MRGRVAVALLLLAAGCRSSPGRENDAVDARLAEYEQLVLRMDHRGIAQLYAVDGELVNAGEEPIRGPEAIETFLRGFSEYHVVSYTAAADTTAVRGSDAWQAGAYRQRVRIPAGDTVEVHGRFQIEWKRDKSGRWLIERMGAIPER